MIVWLASYPKSGNTLTRSILSSYFYSEDGKFKFENLDKIKQFPLANDFMSLGIDPNNDEEVFKNFINVQNFINKKKNKINFLKTHSSLCKVHNSNFTDYQNSLGVIYIVRDPRNIVTSMANHYDISLDEATRIIIDNKKFLDKSPKNCSVFVGSWGFNFNSWKEFQNKNKYILIKYEDLIKNNFIKRGGYRFVWNNKNYSNFDEFLNIFTSRQRKNIRTERNKILKNNISFSIKDKQNITLDDWKTFYEFYKSTYLERMQAPYLNFSFFELIHKNKDILQPVIFFAELNEQSVAGSLCFQGKDILYGRHWGASMMVDSLHFECCYYQGIDYCIKNNIKYFDPGVQGEHKIRRGFEPRLCNSYHYVIKEDFRKAIDSFCIEEYKSIEQYLMACEKYTPIKKEYRI